MTLSELRDAIRQETDTPAAILTDALTLRFVRTALERISNAHDWQGQEATATLAYSAGTDGVALPADFVSEKHVSLVAPGVSDPSQRLRPIAKLMGGREAWLDSFGTASTLQRQEPRFGAIETLAYYLWAEKLYIVPGPTSGQLDLVLDYIASPAELPDSPSASNFLTARYGRTVVLAGAVVEAYRHLRMWAAMKEVQAQFQLYLEGAIKRDRSTALSGPKHARLP